MQTPTNTLRLYWFPFSGHSHRAELMLSLLGLPFEKVVVNLPAREQKQADFLAKNAFGQVPVLEDGEFSIADSTAILVYLAKRYDATGRWLPQEAALAAEVQRWLSVASGPLMQGPALARAAVVFRKQPDPAACERAQQLLAILEAHLAKRDYFVGSGPTIADVALYTYCAHVPEGGVSLEPYAALRAWLARIEGLPGFVATRKSPLPDGA